MPVEQSQGYRFLCSHGISHLLNHIEAERLMPTVFDPAATEQTVERDADIHGNVLVISE